MRTTTRLLLVEDSEDDAAMIREALSEALGGSADIEVRPTLEEALSVLADTRAEIVLLDLGLPDSSGIDTLEAILSRTDLPVVILTATGDEKLGVKTVQLGAQDYLAKDEVTSGVLARTIRYALERQRLRLELARAKSERLHERERASFERLSNSERNLRVGARLADSLSERFEALVERYVACLKQAEEIRVYKVEHDVSGGLEELADSLARVMAGPKDVTDIHTTALRRLRSDISSQQFAVYLEEGRLMALELMGYLMARYRERCLEAPSGQGRRPAAKDDQ